jgi:hypothetical protein
MWEVLDEFGKSVLDTIKEHNEDGLLVQWGKLYQHLVMQEAKSQS